MGANWQWSQYDFPRLTDANCYKKSERRNGYNCIAYAAGDTARWWWPIRLPGVNYWPKGVPRESTMEAFIAAFATCGYALCADGLLEAGVEKVVLFAKPGPNGLIPTHAARQLESGCWTSKLGPLEDIVHVTVDALSGPAYGFPIFYLSRPRIVPAP
ncbi:MAG: hypothetical protein ACLQGV_12605 [Bryobacteraceae bacterium]